MSKRPAADKNNNLDDVDDVPPAKKACQRYKDSYKKTWSFLGPSKKGATFVKCNICDLDFACRHGGKSDCRRHVNSQGHKDLTKLKTSIRQFESYCNKDSSETDRKRQVTRAEANM